MNTNAIIAVVAVLAIGGGGYYAYSQMGSTDSAMTPGAEEQAASGSMRDLLARGSSVCTVTNTVANSTSEGTVYVGNGKMRGDFTSTITSPTTMTVESHMISDGEYVYTWSSQMPQGVKMAVSAADDVQAQGETAQMDLYNAQVSYDCDSWSVDNSKFVVPSDISFMDMTEMMKSIPGAGAGAAADVNVKAGAGMGASAQQCAACDMAPEPQKSQCRAALKCQ